MTKRYRTLVMAALVVVLLGVSLGVGVSFTRAHAANQGSISVMTQNLYQGTEFDNSIAAKTQQQFLTGAAADYNNMIATNFPERADAIAAEIARSGPALVGLQEVALWQTQCPYQSGSWQVSYNFLQILLDRLAAHGMHYTTVITRTNFNLAGVGLFSPTVCPSSGGYMGLRFSEQSAILARTDLPTSQLQLSHSQQGGYQAAVTLNTAVGPITLSGGWLSVDATTQGNTYRFITTHLTAGVGGAPGVQAQQMQELLTGPAATTLPVVIAGDLNNLTTGEAYTKAVHAGFADEWTVANGQDNGYTCCQVLPTINNSKSNLYQRIDYVLARGPIVAQDMHLVGATPSARTTSGLWPSDHAGLVASLEIGQ